MHSALDRESSPYLGRPWRAVRCVLISHSSKMNLPSTKYFPCMAMSTEAESAASAFLDTSLLCSVTVFNFRNLSERDCFCLPPGLDTLCRLLHWVYLTGQCLVPGVKTSLPLSCLWRPGRALESRPGGWLAHLLLPVFFFFSPLLWGRRLQGTKSPVLSLEREVVSAPLEGVVGMSTLALVHFSRGGCASLNPLF